MDEMILIDKPEGMTSFGVVARVRGVLTRRARAEAAAKGVTGPKRVKVGHTGTLDPFATGLLIVMAGKGTKRCQEFLKLDKEYVATLRLGYVSSTGDPEGEIVPFSVDSSSRLSSQGSSSTLGRNLVATSNGTISPSTIYNTLRQFTGRIRQRPPVYSAIKINGQRAYDLARKGVAVEMPEREVEIYEIEALNYTWPELVIRTKVSSGTYIRTLAEDIGRALGCGAYLTALRRTEVGKYRVEEALSLDEWLAENEMKNTPC